MAISPATSSRLRAGLVLGILLGLTPGCSPGRYGTRAALADRILPPFNGDVSAPFATSTNTSPDAAAKPTAPESAKAPGKDGSEEAPMPAKAPEREPAHEPGEKLTLPDAIDLAFRLQPRLRASLESIRQAQGKEDIAFSAFLPVASTAYSTGGFDLNAGGFQTIVGTPASFTFIPALGSVPIGLNIQTGYELAELKLQWLLCDFGRRLGRYNQASLATDIAQLQTDRAYQTVANDVAGAYYQVLRARSLRRIARESVRRAEDDLDVAKKLARGGAVEREKVLRAEVALAQAQRILDVTEEAEAVAVAALNLAIGLNVSTSTCVVDVGDIPPFTLCLAECLQGAVSSRRELQVARQSIRVALEGGRVAHADFAPKIVAEGYANDFQQSSPRAHANLALGFIKLEWGLFEGGKRVAELRVADSQIRAAMAQAESIADTIAFQVNRAYHQLVTARKSIDRSRPSVEQTRETYRLVGARFRLGDATPAELTEAEASLTRAQQDYANSIYDYLTALERLQYAMGTTAMAQTHPSRSAHP